MKGDWLGRGDAGLLGWELVLISLWPPRWEGQVVGELVRWSNSERGPSGGQSLRGTCRSEGFSLGEHVPDRLGELAGDFDPGDFGAALMAETDLGPLVMADVAGVTGGVDGGFDQCPAQVFGAVLDQLAPPVLTAGLVDAGA